LRATHYIGIELFVKELTLAGASDTVGVVSMKKRERFDNVDGTRLETPEGRLGT
jgi:hypothetical protein